jgi:hypothetical protein
MWLVSENFTVHFNNPSATATSSEEYYSESMRSYLLRSSIPLTPSIHPSPTSVHPSLPPPPPPSPPHLPNSLLPPSLPSSLLPFLPLPPSLPPSLRASVCPSMLPSSLLRRGQMHFIHCYIWSKPELLRSKFEFFVSFKLRII